jgi:Mor family transcriptional regulator
MTHVDRNKRRDEIIRRVQAGEDRSDLAQEFGLSLATIKGMTSGLAKTDIGPRTFQIIADLINTEESISDLALKRGCSRQWIYTVVDRLKAVGINIKPR